MDPQIDMNCHFYFLRMKRSKSFSDGQVEKVGKDSFFECFETRKLYLSQDMIGKALPFEEMILKRKIVSIEMFESEFPYSLDIVGLLGKWRMACYDRNMSL